MKNLEKISEELFAKIRGRFPSLTIGDANGKITNDPQQARFFDFDYTVEGVDLGKVTVSLSEDDGVVIVFSNDLMVEVDKATQTQWFNFLKEMRMFAKKRLLNFDTRDITRSNLKTRDFKFLATNNSEEGTMTESKLYGTSKLSYQDFDGARLVIKHNQAVNPELASSRTQNISKIYIESADGERFIYPYRHLNGARAMARHVAEGGNPYDDFGGHITGLSEEISKLRKFKNYMSRSNVMAEGLSGYVDAVIERIGTIKKTVESLQRKSFYQEAVQNFETPVFEDVPNEVKENWIDQLTIRQFNEELADVFPYIYKLVSETTLAEEIGPEDLLGEGQDVDENTVRELLKKFDQKANDDYRAYGDVNPETVIRHLEQGDVEAAIEAVAYEYSGDDGKNPRRGFDNLLQNLEDDFQAVIEYKNDEYANESDKDFGGYDEAIESSIEELMGQFGEEDKKAVDTATSVAQELKKMGVPADASEDEIYDMIPKALKSLGQESVLNHMNISKGYKQDMVNDIIVAFSGMKEADEEAESPMVTATIPNNTSDTASKLQKLAKEKGVEYARQGRTVTLKGKRMDVRNIFFKMAYSPGNHPEMVPVTEGRDDAPEGDRVTTDENPLVTNYDDEFTPGKPGIAGHMNLKTWMSIHAIPAEYQEKLANAVVSAGRGKQIKIPDEMKADYDAERDEAGLKPRALWIELSMHHEKEKESDASESDMSDSQEPQLPLSEKILSYFDPKEAKFPKGETAVLTMIEKEYGDEYIEPAKQFIEMIYNKVAEARKPKKDNDDLPFEPDAEPTPDTDEFGNPIKHKAKHLARKSMKKELDRIKGLAGL